MAEKLTDFLSSKVSYTVRRVLAAEKERLYRGPGDTGMAEIEKGVWSGKL